MARHRVFKFYRKGGKALVYIPALRELSIAPKAKVERMEDFISSDSEDEIPHKKTTFPPRFDAVDFHLTYKCNMKCVYCYAEANRHGHQLSRAQIWQSLNYLFRNYSSKEVRVHFLGGEPVMAMDTLKYAVDCAREMSESCKVPVFFTMTSNGIWSREQYDYIVDNFSRINISFDGICEVHDRQRLFLSGGKSYKLVHETIGKLCGEKHIDLTTKTLVSADSVGKMTDTVILLCRDFSGIRMQFEPLHELGAVVDETGVRAPDINSFLNEYMKCKRIVDGMEGATNTIITSYFRGFEYPLSTTFCGCFGDNFIVTGSGLITACDEVTRSDQLGAGEFLFGHVDDHGIHFQEEMYRRLSCHDVANCAVCRNCFALYGCRGGCPMGNMICSCSHSCLPNAHCDDIKKWITEYLWLLAETGLKE